MKRINNENIDEIMFQLLEGDIIGSEREQLLEAIHSDPAYLILWETWQKTVLHAEEIPFNIKPLKHKKTIVIPFYLKYAAAAIVIFGMLIFINKDNIKPAELAILPPKIKTFKNPLPQLQKDTFYHNQLVNDTFVPFKEKVKYLVEKGTMHQKIDQIMISNDSIIVNCKNIEKESTIANKIEFIEEMVETNKEEIFVSISSDLSEKPIINTKERSSFLSRLLGKSSIKIEPDNNTRTKRKVIFENKKYQIIAGF